MKPPFIQIPILHLIAILPCLHASDSLALLFLKASFVSDPLQELSSWNDSSTNFCGWKGVTCDRRHPARVSRLNLSSFGISGTIPPSIANLTFLQTLDLSGNRLHGGMPPELCNLRRLRYLNLSLNSFGGAIPSTLSKCTSLVFLSLRKNIFTGNIPASIGNLSTLQYLDFSYNNLTGEIPASIGNLSALVFLDTTMNQLWGEIPPSLGRLTSLVVVKLKANSLSGRIPPEFGFLSSLLQLELSFNMLSDGVPSSIYNLSSLEVLNLGNNYLVGNLPPNFGLFFPNLSSLFLYFNHFHGSIPLSLANATELQDIELTGNNFTGKIPSNLGMLQDLYWLSLDRNQLAAGDEEGWSFINSLANCSQLQVLSLELNGLGGALPSSIVNLSRTLEWLTMGSNQLHGNIPAEIENLSNLTMLGLEYNFLEGSIPAAIGKLYRIDSLYLFSNRLSGSIPSTLGDLSQLSYLNIELNGLEGSIPASLGRCHDLKTLDLSDNKLTGSIPIEVLKISSLSKYLDLSSNLLSGPLPPEVGELRNLRAFYVESNNLTGEIPEEIGQCEVLEILHLNLNKFHGGIPPSLSKLKGIQEMNLAGNNLSGLIPEFMEDLIFLKSLNLSYNNFEGPVPTKGIFQNISAFSVHGNEELCGGDEELKLADCSSETYRKGNKTHRLKLILPLVAAALTVIMVLCLLSLCYRKYIRRNYDSNLKPKDSVDAQYAQVSYYDILKATNGFSSANLIGVGGYGSVYKGVLKFGNETPVAVKVFNLQQRGALKSFKDECNALRSIRHRNLVKILTSCCGVDGNGDDFKALIYQYMPNGSLDKWLHEEEEENGRLSFLQRINVAIDVATALEYLHHHGSTPFVHCDLKPSNVLLDEDMTAHVSDFGLAKMLGAGESYSFLTSSTASIGVKGTIGYAAPEYGMTNRVSVKGDVYSFGLLLLEMFTGRRPIDESLMEGLTLRKFVEMALPEYVMDIIDPYFLSEGNGERIDEKLLKECLILALQIGLSCSKELPKDRMGIHFALNELYEIKEILSNANV